MTPYKAESVFSVTSNSTLSSFAFDSAKKELSFGVAGPSGTTGYVDMYIPISLLTDASGLKVYLDGNQLNFSSAPQGDSWLVSFTYNHSTHEVTLTFGSASPTSPNGNQAGQWALYSIAIPAIAIAAIAVIAVYLKKRKN